MFHIRRLGLGLLKFTWFCIVHSALWFWSDLRNSYSTEYALMCYVSMICVLVHANMAYAFAVKSVDWVLSLCVCAPV